MATATLPYPNMDFTPLDVLTAAEMDHMVANTEYLKNFCNGLADGSNLSDGVIQARHIKYSTINLPAPDYASEVTTLTLPHTLTSDNWIRILPNGAEVSINGRVVASGSTAGVYVIVPARKGDKITKTGSGTPQVLGLGLRLG